MSRTTVAEPPSATHVSVSSASGPELSDLSHALRNPIATIQNYCELMLACPPDTEAERRSFVRTIAEEAEHLSRMVADLVDLERARTTTPAEEPCDLRDAVHRAALSLHPLAAERGVVVEVDHSDFDGTIAIVVASPTRIERAVFALIENAIRFSPAGGSVAVELGRETGGGWLIAVSDHGPGVPAAAVPHIFDKFYRAATPPDADSFKSAGLGLALAHAIVAQAGGSLAYEPAKVGARFALRLPARG